MRRDDALAPRTTKRGPRSKSFPSRSVVSPTTPASHARPCPSTVISAIRGPHLRAGIYNRPVSTTDARVSHERYFVWIPRGDFKTGRILARRAGQSTGALVNAPEISGEGIGGAVCRTWCHGEQRSGPNGGHQHRSMAVCCLREYGDRPHASYAGRGCRECG